MPFIDGDGAGDTAYFGSRKSERHGRLYDKALESGDPAYENCWRYEAEYKGDVGHATFIELASQPQYREAALQILVGQLGVWSIALPVPPTLQGVVLRVPSEETTIERSERWLLAQVLPTLARLVDTGHQEIVDRLFRQVYNLPNE